MKIYNMKAYRRLKRNINAINEMIHRGYLDPIAGRDMRKRVKARYNNGEYDNIKD